MVEHTVFTWDPVGARWIHERGPQMTPPPSPPDPHAIQTYFFDRDNREWIPTVLAPRGRELAAKWQGAYKVPQAARAAAPQAARSNPIPIIAAVLAVVLVGGGAIVVAGQLSPASPAATAATNTNTNTSGGTSATTAPTSPGATAASSAAASATPPGATQAAQVTAAPTRAPTAPPRTVAPTPVPPPPVGNGSATLADGTVVYYEGPSRLDLGVKSRATFTVRTPAGSGTGTLLVTFSSPNAGSKQASGVLDAAGRLSIEIPAMAVPGNYAITVIYKGMQAQVATLRVG